MDDPESPLSPTDAGADPGPYLMPDSLSLSASPEQDLPEARVLGISNSVDPHCRRIHRALGGP